VAAALGVQPVGLLGGSILVLSRVLPGLAGDTIDNPHAQSPKNRAVGEVDGERVVTEPEEQAVGEQVLKAGGEENGDGNALDHEGGRAATGIGPLRNNERAARAITSRIDEELVETEGPRRPVLVLMGVGADVATDKEEGGHDDVGENALVLGDKVLGRTVLGQLGEEGTESEVGTKGFSQGSSVQEPVGNQEDVDENAVAETHANGGSEDNVDLEGSNKQGAHSPLMSVVNILGGGPSRKHGSKQPAKVLAERFGIGGIEADPEAITTVGSSVGTEDGQHEADEGGDDGREDQPRRSSEGGPGDGLEGSRVVPLDVCELQGLGRADEACEEGKDGHTETALPGNAEVWNLEQSRAAVLNIGRPEEREVQRSGNMCRDNEGGGDATEALDPFDVLFTLSAHLVR